MYKRSIRSLQYIERKYKSVIILLYMYSNLFYNIHTYISVIAKLN